MDSPRLAGVAQPPEDGYGSDPFSAEWTSFEQNTGDGCPPINFSWGWQDVANTPNASGFENHPATYARVLSCTDSIEIIDTKTSLLLPDLKIDNSNPPAIVPQPRYDNMTLNIWNTMTSRYNIITADLKEPASIDKIVTALKSAHGIIRAQQYSTALRVDIANATGVPEEFSATLVQENRWRLVQNAVSTHILCGVLCAMLLCLALASWFSSTNYVLPKNPGSIGTQLSLLADSNILEDDVLMQQIERVLRDKKALEDLSGLRFHMGWFERGEDEKRIWTINSVKAKDHTQRCKLRSSTSSSLRCCELRLPSSQLN
ncbi:hypothetical protein LTR70_008120 [Exophiala xenobiotica]|uniref:Uncharacterized protein n=1 Tax=Lithohypha guttulata TaxID=1690604 RepID=A0ABR0JXT6_9EURO|nr:hypothetical protein LTR24_009182 [Lithohypha guttulata]KAK5312523.1 hypothetical protein LTR70_008120 [Exophiala xenobiotica]